MRQMVLNHASVHPTGSSREAVTDWLADLSIGMAKLVNARVVESQLRTEQEPYQTPCLADYSLFDAFLGLREAGYREQSRFLLSLSTKAPLLRDAAPDVADRFLGCEGVSVPPREGEPLVLCAITNWVVVGFPSAPSWDQDQLTVQFNELLSNGALIETSEVVDNLTRSPHATPISQRHSERLARGSDPATLWENRRTCFPDILFGPDVEGNLRAHARLHSIIVGKLIDINRSAADWKSQGGPAPNWRVDVTDENDLEPKYLKERRFASLSGERKLFTWHAKFGNGYRIHLRLDAGLREVEIGYIGPHLPL